MWTVQIQNKERIDDSIKLLISFSNGTDSFTHQFTFSSGTSLDQIKRTVRDFVARLENVDTVIASLPSGEINVDVSDPVIVDTEQQLFQKKLNKLKSAQRAIDLGVILNTNTQYTTLLNSVKTDMKAEYLELF